MPGAELAGCAEDTVLIEIDAEGKICVKAIWELVYGAYMNYKIADIPIESLTTAEIGMLRRMAARYYEIMREHTYLVGLMNLAVRAGDTNLLATTKKRLAETEKQRNECFSGLENSREEVNMAASEGGHVAA